MAWVSGLRLINQVIACYIEAGRIVLQEVPCQVVEPLLEPQSFPRLAVRQTVNFRLNLVSITIWDAVCATPLIMLIRVSSALSSLRVAVAR